MLKEFKKKLIENKEVYIRIKVRPCANKTLIKDIIDDETIKIDIKAVPEKNKANIELIKFLSKEFNIKPGNIRIISGAAEKTKLIKIFNN